MTASTCRGCGAAVHWATHAVTGSRMIFDAAPAANGAWDLKTDALGTVAHYVPVKDPRRTDGRSLYNDHHATCRNVADFRKVKR